MKPKKRIVYYTPNAVRAFVESLLKKADPSAGSGGFLADIALANPPFSICAEAKEEAK